jgi:hypothetical protein
VENSLELIKMTNTEMWALIKEAKIMPLKKIHLNPDNPRVIEDAEYKKLVTSVRDFPIMLKINPIKVNENMMVLGGNQRLKACIDAGYKEVPIMDISALTPEQQDEFLIKDNLPYGQWDWDIIAGWDLEMLDIWGLDVPDNLDEIKETKDIPEKGKIEFSEELLLEHNYVVLYFDNPMDWEVACDKLGLKTVKTKTPDKSSKIGIGRVIRGSDILPRL